jgi:hypothetical protein
VDVPNLIPYDRGLPVHDDTPRRVIETALSELEEPAETVSTAIGMPRTYLRLYLNHRLPRALPARVRRRLASYLGVPESTLR